MRPEPCAQVVQVGGQREDHHDLAGGRDVEAGLPGYAVDPGAEPDHVVAQRAVVDVEDAPPGDAVRVEPELVAVVQVVVDHRGQQVVRGGHGVEVAGQVQVHALHRHHLAVAAARGAALDAERRPHRRLAQRDRRRAPPGREPLGQTDGRRGLALAERRGRDRRDEDVLGGGPVGERGLGPAVDLGDVPAVELEQLRPDAGSRGHLLDGSHRRRAGDLEVGGHGGGRRPRRRCHGPEHAPRRRPCAAFAADTVPPGASCHDGAVSSAGGWRAALGRVRPRPRRADEQQPRRRAAGPRALRARPRGQGRRVRLGSASARSAGGRTLDSPGTLGPGAGLGVPRVPGRHPRRQRRAVAAHLTRGSRGGVSRAGCGVPPARRRRRA